MNKIEQTLFGGFHMPHTPGIYRHFKFSEFDSPDEPGSGKKMDDTFLYTLDMIRDMCGFPFIITSGYRSEAYNQHLRDIGKKSVDGSAHTKGLACDIKIASSSQRMDIVRFALKLGINRIGIGSDFIHLDADVDKTRGVMWVYS